MREHHGPVICGVAADAPTETVRVAAELADRFGIGLQVAHVVGLPHGERDVAAGEALLRQLVASAPPDTLVSVESGHPVDRLVGLAGERRASFVVVGTRGSRASLLGSVSAEVARRAPCPVVVVPPSETAAEGDPARDTSFAGGIVRFELGAPRRRAAAGAR